MSTARLRGRPSPVPLLSRLLIAFSALLAVVLLAPPASAIDDPTLGPARKGDPFPVQVTIDSITPTIVTGGDAAPDSVTIAVTITNTSDREIDDLWARLQRDSRVTSRAALNALDAEQPSYSGPKSPDTDLDFTLQPGSSESFELTATFDDLGMSDDGTYPVMVNLNGDIGGDPQRVGQASIYLPYAEAISGQVQASWVWPLIDRPHQSATPDLFIDDDLAAAITSGGRLDVLLSAAEKYGAAANLTLLIDPALVDELTAMSDGYNYVDDSGAVVAGTHAEDAQDFLNRLTDLAAKVTVTTTSYGDMDTVALVRGGLGDLVAASRDYGTTLVDDALQTSTVSDIDWPASGVITTDALAVEQSAGVSRVILSGAAFGMDDYLTSDDEVTESSLTALPNDASALVADPALSRIIGEGSSYAAGPVAATQRLTAELFAILQEAPTRARNVLLVPPRHWSPSEEYAESLLALTTTSGWISPIGLDSVLSAPPQDRGELIYPSELSQHELNAQEVAAIPNAQQAIDSMRTAFTETDADKVLQRPGLTIYQSASVANRDKPGAVTQLLSTIDQRLAALRGGISIVPPSDGTYTLSSSEAPLVFTVENNLDVTVRYRITLDKAHSSGLTVDDATVLEIGPRQRATVQLDTKVERSGSFSVLARLITPDGQQLGTDVQIRVISSAYGTVALLVTGAAFVVLLLLISRRAIKRHRFRVEQRALLATDVSPHHVTLDDAAISSSWLDDPVADTDDIDAAGNPPDLDDPHDRHNPDQPNEPTAGDEPTEDPR